MDCLHSLYLPSNRACRSTKQLKATNPTKEMYVKSEKNFEALSRGLVSLRQTAASINTDLSTLNLPAARLARIWKELL